MIIITMWLIIHNMFNKFDIFLSDRNSSFIENKKKFNKKYLHHTSRFIKWSIQTIYVYKFSISFLNISSQIFIGSNICIKYS